MIYKYINYEKIINKITKKDNLFFGDYIIDPYQNCEFDCKYCDSIFDKTIFIKNDFLNKIQSEIEEIQNGTIIIGSVVDPYQNIEKKLNLTRNLLKIIKKHDIDVHILTKSTLIMRDIDILRKIKNASVTISIISLNKNVINYFEKIVPSSLERLKLIKKLSEFNINSGLAIIPILPYIIEDEIEDILKNSLIYKANYVIYKFLELKGFQKKYFFDYLKIFNNNLLKKYLFLYKDSFYPNIEYIEKINNKFGYYSKKYNLENVIRY
jgi:DNA repair photolyase